MPLIGILVASFQLCFFSDALKDFDQGITRFIYNTFLLSSTHLVFPFALLLSMPAFRLLAQRKLGGQNGSRNKIILGLVILILATLLVFDSGQLPLSDNFQWLVNKFFFWLWILVPTIHGMRQSGGLGILFNRSLSSQLDSVAQQRLQSFEQKERHFLNAIYCATLGALIAQGAEAPPLVTWSLFLLAWLFGATLLFMIQREACFANTDKFLFSTRMLFWPMAGYSYLAKWIIGVMHGHEYIGLINKMLGDAGIKIKKRVLITTWVFVGGVVVYDIAQLSLYFKGKGFFDLYATDKIVAYALLLFPLMAIGHYLIDSLLYRMRDGDVRELIKPLVSGFVTSKNQT